MPNDQVAKALADEDYDRPNRANQLRANSKRMLPKEKVVDKCRSLADAAGISHRNVLVDGRNVGTPWTITLEGNPL